MEKKKFVFLGDSLVADFNWQNRMPFFEVINLGIPGETTQGLQGRLASVISGLKSPDIILVSIGTNDVLGENYSFTAGLDKIIINLSKAFPETEIIVNSLFPIQTNFLTDEAILRINNEINDMTRRTGSCFLNMFDRFKGSGSALFQADGVHLTEKAYDLWARSIMETLAFLLEDD